MPTTERRHSKEEFERRGDAIYEKEIRPKLSSKDKGRFVAIDIETGEYEIASDRIVAGDRLQGRLPDAQIWMVRVGHRYVRRIGGRAGRVAR